MNTKNTDIKNTDIKKVYCIFSHILDGDGWSRFDLVFVTDTINKVKGYFNSHLKSGAELEKVFFGTRDDILRDHEYLVEEVTLDEEM